ncbi:flavin reductase family protein [Micromonospora wenchangensis]|uniref:flavin reductase family protein n=1 Tax=Micromonospora wenchangensis TaxID=1185415 RepID=UPI003D72AB23
MNVDLPPQLWRTLTSTVGLVAVPAERGTNVLAVEWSYFVNKEPLYVAVVLGPRTASRPLIAAAGRFAVTFCAEEQAGLADLAGSCSVTEVDKHTSEALRFGPYTLTPWVTGGVVAVECALRQVVPLPVHTMYLGEVVAAHLPEQPVRPLVKHDGMYGLGAPVRGDAVTAAVRMLDDGWVRVVASAPPASPAHWRVSLVDPAGAVVRLDEIAGERPGRLVVEVPLPVDRPPDARIRVEHGDARPGHAVLA